MLKDLVQSSRSYRRFDHSAPVSMHILEELVELARLCPSAANKQPLRFILSTAPSDNDAIFACLKWAPKDPRIIWAGTENGGVFRMVQSE